MEGDVGCSLDGRALVQADGNCVDPEKNLFPLPFLFFSHCYSQSWPPLDLSLLPLRRPDAGDLCVRLARARAAGNSPLDHARLRPTTATLQGPAWLQTFTL